MCKLGQGVATLPLPKPTKRQEREMLLNISNLSVNQEIKNYKELCILLGQPVKSSKSKRLQLKDFERYFVYSRNGNKYIIKEIFPEPLPKVDGRAEGNHSKYVEHVKFLLLNKLATSEGYKCTFTKNNLFEFLGMVNPRYLKRHYAKQLINDKDGRIKNFDINNFYLRANDRLTRILFDSLNSLKRQFLIEYKEVTMVVRLNKFGNEEHTQATEDEVKLIMGIKRDVLTDMGLNSMTQVIFKFKTEEFYNKVNSILTEEFDIKYSYKQLEIIFIRKNIIEELERLNQLNHRKELNTKVINVVNQDASNRYKKNLKEYDEGLDEFLLNEQPAFGKYTETQFKGFKYQDDYVDIQRELAEYLMMIE